MNLGQGSLCHDTDSGGAVVVGEGRGGEVWEGGLCDS